MRSAQDDTKPGPKSAALRNEATARDSEPAGRKLAPSPSRPRTRTSPEKQKVSRSDDPFARPAAANKTSAAPDVIAREHASRARVNNATDSSGEAAAPAKPAPAKAAPPKPSGWDSTPAAPPPRPKPDADRHKQPKTAPALRPEPPATSPAASAVAKATTPALAGSANGAAGPAPAGAKQAVPAGASKAVPTAASTAASKPPIAAAGSAAAAGLASGPAPAGAMPAVSAIASKAAPPAANSAGSKGPAWPVASKPLPTSATGSATAASQSSGTAPGGAKQASAACTSKAAPAAASAAPSKDAAPAPSKPPKGASESATAASGAAAPAAGSARQQPVAASASMAATAAARPASTADPTATSPVNFVAPAPAGAAPGDSRNGTASAAATKDTAPQVALGAGGSDAQRNTPVAVAATASTPSAPRTSEVPTGTPAPAASPHTTPDAAAAPPPRKLVKRVSMAGHLPTHNPPPPPPPPPPEPERRIVAAEPADVVAPFAIPLPMIALVRWFRPAAQRHILHAVLHLPTDNVPAEHKALLSIADLAVAAQRETAATAADLAGDAALALPRRARTRRRTRRQRVHALMSDPASSRGAQAVSLVILAAIVASTVTHCYSTMPGVPSSPLEAEALVNTERVTTALFTAEYLVRLATCDSVPAFMRSALNAIDLVAILPFYLELILDRALGSVHNAKVTRARTGDLSITRALRVVRLVRVLRVLKVGAQYRKLQVISAVVAQSRDILGVLVFMLTIAVLLFSSLTYYSEQIDSELLHSTTTPSPFRSIPGTFWWCMVTLSTIGYGDQVPATALGKVTAGVSMVCAIVITALPISVIGTQFTQRWANFSKQHKRELRTAVAFETLARVTDTLTDHINVMQDFGSAERVCDLRLRHCLLQLHASVQLVELAHAAGLSGGRSPKDAAAAAKAELPRLRRALVRATRSHLELRALLHAAQCGNDPCLTAAVSELFTSYQQLTKWYEESHFLLDDFARMRRQMQVVKRGIYEGPGKASTRAGSQQT